MVIENVNTPDLQVKVSEDEGVLTLMFQGEASNESARRLDALLAQCHHRCQEPDIAEVEVDFRDLEFMNSTCFKCFVTWLQRLRGLSEDHRYRIRFVSDNNRHWQRRSLDALSCFAIDLVEIDSR